MNKTVLTGIAFALLLAGCRNDKANTAPVTPNTDISASVPDNGNTNVSQNTKTETAAMVYANFTASGEDIANPERGFYRYTKDPANIASGDLQYVVDSGERLIYTPADLSQWRNQDLPADYLNRLNSGFQAIRESGLKAIVRFAYNYPSGGEDYTTVQDAPLSQVQRHIQQLQPVIQANADVIAVWQAGFVGAWGEWHSSSNDLTSDENKLAVRNALLAALPEGRQLQVRYPRDLVKWFDTAAATSDLASNGTKARIGMYNDCFMAGTDDVGTYFKSYGYTQSGLRQFVREHSAITAFGGETCTPQTGARLSCSDILSEGREYHLAYLNKDFSTDFINSWESGGCMADVRKNIGYRFVLGQVGISSETSVGGNLSWAVKLSNAGWARALNSRDLVVRLVGTNGSTTDISLSGTDLRTVDAGGTVSWNGSVTLPASLSAGSYSVEIGAPDPSSTLAGNPMYAVRFANSDSGSIRWNASTGFLATGLNVTVR